MRRHSQRYDTAGFTLIEVLVAVLVFSIGLLGMAGLMTVSLKINQGAYLRSQAIFLAQSISDRMRANSIGVWQGAYAFDSSRSTNSATACDSTSACSPAVLAQYDIYAWKNQLADFLPPPPSDAAATIVCTPRNSTSAALGKLVQKPPYDGFCTVTLNWSERTLNPDQKAATASAVLQTFALTFQP